MAADETLAATATAGAEPTKEPAADQLALWQSLKPDHRLALREREAVRLFSQGLEHHQKASLKKRSGFTARP
jgi:hypothetical protein